MSLTLMFAGGGVIDDVAIPLLEIINGGLLVYEIMSKAEDKTDYMGKPKGNTPGNNQGSKSASHFISEKVQIIPGRSKKTT